MLAGWYGSQGTLGYSVCLQLAGSVDFTRKGCLLTANMSLLTPKVKSVSIFAVMEPWCLCVEWRIVKEQKNFIWLNCVKENAGSISCMDQGYR